jgi:hypothetical protein
MLWEEISLETESCTWLNDELTGVEFAKMKKLSVQNMNRQ